MKTNQGVEHEPNTPNRDITRRLFLTALGAAGLASFLPRSAFSQAEPGEAPASQPVTAPSPDGAEALTSTETEKPWQLFAEAHPGKIENWNSMNPASVRTKIEFPITGVPAASIALELDVWADNTRRGAAQNIPSPGTLILLRENSGIEMIFDKATDSWVLVWGIKEEGGIKRKLAPTELKGGDLKTRMEINKETVTYTMPDGSVKTVDLQGINLIGDTTLARCGWIVQPNSTMDIKTIKVFTRELPPVTEPAAPETPAP